MWYSTKWVDYIGEGKDSFLMLQEPGATTMADKRPLEDRVGNLEGRMSTVEKDVGSLQTASDDMEKVQDERHEDTNVSIRRIEKWLITILLGILSVLITVILKK